MNDHSTPNNRHNKGDRKPEHGTRRSGLTDAEVLENRRRFGDNVLTPPKKTSLWKLYLEKYKDPIIIILLVAAGISLCLAFVENDFIETIGILLAIFLATTVAFYFERDAAKKFSALTAANDDQKVKVRRNGHITQVPRRDVVVGDIIFVEVGDEIPADAKLIKSTNLQVDESSLTGEQLTTKRVLDSGATSEDHTADDPKQGQTAAAQKANEAAYPEDVILRSTMVMNGHGEAVVTKIGDKTEIGKVARTATETTHVKTPLNIQLGKLASLISKIGSGVAIAAFVIFLAHDIITDDQGIWAGRNYVAMAQHVLNYFMMAVTLIVMAVPEGLPMAVNLSLALNMRRMLKSNNLVRKLQASETMGAVTVICTDKTGTLTQNKMQVASMNVVAADGSFAADAHAADQEQLCIAIAVNSTANLDGTQVIGNPTEGALLLWMKDGGIDYLPLRQKRPIQAMKPFSTEDKFMATTVEYQGTVTTYVKGAPEIIMRMCNISDAQRLQAEHILSDYQHRAMRTLAFACCDGPFRKEGLTLQALTAISDPVRQDVPAAVQECVDAGIKVKIVTGDTSATAIEIARQIGIWPTEDDNAADPATPDDKESEAARRWCITGPEFAALSDDEAYDCVEHLRVMSRARPSDKQRLVTLLQKHGEVVAVTGDGTNDAPALNFAHVGVSLGSGTSVAKQASDITLLDDSFHSLATAVMWGRSLYKNIQRFLFFQLVVNLSALLLVLGGAVIGTEMPLTVTQILWVNLIMDTFAALALASLPPSREVMKAKPRKQNEFIITHDMAKGILFCGIVFGGFMIGLLYYLEYCNGRGVGTHDLTRFFTTFVMLQFWNLFNAKCFGSDYSAFHHFWRDRGLILVLALILFGQWLIVEFGGRMFRTEAMPAEDWLRIFVPTGIVVLGGGELYRGLKRLHKHWLAKKQQQATAKA